MIGATDILLVVPPPLASPSPWQESRQLQRLLVWLPGHEVTGTAHLPADQAQAPDRLSPSGLPAVDRCGGRAVRERRDAAPRW